MCHQDCRDHLGNGEKKLMVPHWVEIIIPEVEAGPPRVIVRIYTEQQQHQHGYSNLQ